MVELTEAGRTEEQVAKEWQRRESDGGRGSAEAALCTQFSSSLRSGLLSPPRLPGLVNKCKMLAREKDEMKQ